MPAVPTTEAPLLRRKAVEFLKAYRDAGAGEISIGAEERLPTSLRLASDFELADEDMGLYLEELSLDPWARGLQWQTPPPQDRLEAFNVIVIGGGLGGLNAALQLKRAGSLHRHREERRRGGTGVENRYPGCRVDTQIRSYRTSRRRLQLSLLALPRVRERAYFHWVADRSTCETALSSRPRCSRWRGTRPRASGWCRRRPRRRANATRDGVVTAVGFLNRPKLPDIEGIPTSGGRPSTRRVGRTARGQGQARRVIGTGASGYQMIPELAL